MHGYQGSEFSAPDKLAATIKHFGAYGAPVAGREYNTVDMSTQQLFNDYLPPYKAAVDAGAATVMSSFNSLNGVPNTANPYLLTTILRDEWGFGGTTLSDYQAVQELEDFGYASDGADAARLALTAGENIEMAVQVGPTSPYSTYENFGPQLLKSGKITMKDLNNAVRHVLTLKYLAGMFTDPYQGSTARVASSELTPAHLSAARSIADESMVLLKNNHALPLSTSTSKIAVVGPLADDALDQLGPDVPIGYDTAAAHLKTSDKIVTVADGIKAVDPAASVRSVSGCNTFTVTDPCSETSGFGAAVAAAQASDVTVVVVGEPAGDSGEASSRTDISLPGQQLRARPGDRCDRQAVRGGTDERPPADHSVVSEQCARPARGVVSGHRGSRRGRRRPVRQGRPERQAADVLPGQRTPVPVSYNELLHRPAVRPEQQVHLQVPGRAQLAAVPVRLRALVHHVLILRLACAEQRAAQRHVPRHRQHHEHRVGNRHRCGATLPPRELRGILQPVKELEGFQRVTLGPNQTKTVTFTLGPQNLGFYNRQGQFVVEPGPFDLWMGDSSVGVAPELGRAAHHVHAGLDDRGEEKRGCESLRGAGDRDHFGAAGALLPATVPVCAGALTGQQRLIL